MWFQVKIRTLKLIISLLLPFNFTCVYSQFQSPGITRIDSIGYVYVTGRVERNRKPLENASIIIYEGNKKIEGLRTPANGKFAFKLEFEKDYNIEITKGDMVVKKFEFDTKLPDDVSRMVIYTFDFAIALFPKYDYIDMSILDKPLAIIMYQKKYDAFFYEYNYAKSINDKVIELENKINELIKEYDKSVDEGRKLLKLEQYRESLTKFERAHDIFPDEPYPIEKIALIHDILNKDKYKKEAYTKLIAEAELKVRNKEYENAINIFEQAIQIIPTEKYPVERIAEIKKILNDIKLKEDKYKLAIDKGDKSFENKMYSEAETFYSEASSLFPERQYPKDKIAEIYKLQHEINNETLYENYVKEGDKLLNNLQYLNAITAYEKALTYEPDRQYPKEKIAYINTKLKEISYVDNLYKQTIDEADKLFVEKDYVNSKTAYNKASKLKPDEQYPKDRIQEIDKLIISLKSQEDLYEKAIANADENLDNMDYKGAIEEYNNALIYEPNDKYAKSQIPKLNNIIDQNSKMEGQYNKLITLADKLTEDKDYSKAKITYQDAIEIKPTENYPKERINNIEKILAEENNKSKIYWNIIDNADESFDLMELDKAKNLYKQASELVPDDKYSKDKIQLLTNLIETKQSAEESYARVIVSADITMAAKDYVKAKELYLRATEIKPGEKYPKDKLKEIEDIINGFEDIKSLYNSYIIQADDMFDLHKYKEARDIYVKASILIPIQKYPKQRIDEINKLLVTIEYDKAIEEVNNELIEKLSEKKFSFNPIRDKGKENYLLLEVTNLIQRPYKMLIFYGKDDVRNGGFEVDIKKQRLPVKYIVRLGTQENWINIQNDWISIQPIGGDIEVNSIKINKGNLFLQLQGK